MWAREIGGGRYNLLLKPESASSAARVSNLDMLPAHRSAGLFFQVNVVPVEWRAIETIQKSSVNRCAGVLLRCTVLIYARRDELFRQRGQLRHVMERFAHKRSNQVPPESPRLNAQRLRHLHWLLSPKRSCHPGCCARQSSTSSRPATKAPGPRRKPHALAARVVIVALRPNRNRPR
jgi:hypothetical protein